MAEPDRWGVCIGGPAHGRVVRLAQEVGCVAVAVAPREDGGRMGTAPYAITHETRHHPCQDRPFVVLRWEGDGDDEVPEPG